LSLLSFRNIVRNPSLDANEFSFEVPRGADVFNQ
jgi:outer membrane lipoprotein-sorting protein